MSGLTYLAMFAVPLAGSGRGLNAPASVKLSAVSGLLMTTLYVGLSILPIIPVGSRTVFALKIVGLIALTILIGAGVYVIGRRASASDVLPS